MHIYAGNSTGADILDRHKNLFAPNSCLRSEDTFSSGGGAFVVNKAGPVRAIRSYLGANSGPYTQREHVFYERRQDVMTFLRVHQIQAIMDFFDYSPAAAGMVYYNDFNQSGVTIDGVPDTPAAGRLQWEMLNGPQGALAIIHTLTTNIPDLTFTSYYLDNTNPPDPQCTGDSYAYGSSGLWINQPIPCTSVKGNCGDTFIYSLTTKRSIYYESPGLTVSDTATRSNQVANPLQHTTQPWQAGTPTPTPTPTPTATPTPSPTPLAPSNLTAAIVSASQINLSWVDNSGTENGFRVERCAGAGCTNFTQIAEIAANAAGFNDTGLAASTTYAYRVRAYNDGGNSDYSNSAGATTLVTLPNAPGSLSASAASSSQINLSWSDNSSNESGFRIERCQGSGCTNFAQVAQVGAGATVYSDTGLSASTSYIYRVRAFNGGGDSAYSNISQATTSAPLSPPAAPTALKASAASTTQINLTWVDNSGNEDGFKIERCTDSGCKNFVQVAQVGSNSKSFSNTGLVANTMYVYRVRAFNAAGDSAYSSSASARTRR